MTCRIVGFEILLACLLLAGCATVPHDLPKDHSSFISDTDETHFGSKAAEWAEAHDGKSGFYPIVQGMDALGARLRLLEKSEKSVDLQYFLMKDDTAGRVARHALTQAADRGVRVRFLLDDIFSTAADSDLVLLNEHPNIEVRLFNPVSRKGIHWLNFTGNFRQANRRMHNKSFTVDNAISIVGGRNIADEYFQLKDTSVFADFDVLAFGPITTEILESFDSYWNHSFAIPIDQLVSEVPDEKDSGASARYEEIYREAMDSQLLQEVIDGTRQLVPAHARVLVDRPDKLENAAGPEHRVLARGLREVLNNVESEAIFITPCYVPREDGMQLANSLVGDGVRVVVATNSLASNNHIPVHSGYTRYRKDVVRAGVELYETRGDAGRFTGSGDGPELFTLHTKLILIDRRYLFVGSLNLDPRSVDINAEMGLLIDSEELASTLAVALEEVIPSVAYRVRLNESGRLRWHGLVDGDEVIEASEPQSGVWRRFLAWVMKLAPESQL